MSVIIHDECTRYLYYASETMKEWIPITDYEYIFEAAINQEVKDKIVKNEETANKSSGFLKKAIDAVMKIINNVIESIQEFIYKLTMSGEEREAFENFKQLLQQDPGLRNKKISVLDFKKLNVVYDKMIQDIDNAINNLKNDASYSIEDIMKQATDFIKGNISAATSIVTTEVAVKMANSNLEIAKNIKNMLDNEKDTMESLTKSLGKKDAKKFKNQIDAAAKNTKLHQLKVLVCRQKYDSLQECIQSVMKSFQQVDGGTIRMAKRALDNEYTGKTIKTVAGTVVKGKVEQGTQKIKEKTAGWFQRKPKPEKTTGVHKPAMDFITGKK